MYTSNVETPREAPPYRQVCPAVIVSVEEQGAAVARALDQRVEEQWDDLPVVRAVRLETEHDGTDNAERIVAAVRSLHQLELVQAVRRRGWTLRHRDGMTIFVLIPSNDQARQRGLQPVLAALHTYLARLNSGIPALAGIFFAAGAAAASLGAPDVTHLSAVLDPADFTGGCYRVAAANTHGLTFADPQRWTTMIAEWIFELLTTPLGPAVTALPSPAERSWSSFGLARWSLPISALREALSHRWQIALLDALLAPAARQQGRDAVLSLPIPEPHPQATRKPALFAGRQVEWAWPGLPKLATLRLRLDDVFEAGLATLNQDARAQERRLDRLLADAETALRAAVADVLNTPAPARLATACYRVHAAQRAAVQKTRAAQQRTLDLEAYLEKVEQERAANGDALDSAQARMPPWTLRAWLGVLLRPWRWPRVVLRYLDLRKAARAYVGTLEHLWLLHLRAHEAGWRVAYRRGTAEILTDLHKQLRAFQHRLDELRTQRIAAAPDMPALLAQLDAAALPAETVEQLYQRGYAPPQAALAALLGTSPTLSDFVELREGPQYLEMAIEDLARERFDFVQHLRLDRLLVRTHSAGELRRRLAALLEAAAPFCLYDRARLSPDKRADVVHATWLGLPDGESSPLVDLVATDASHVYVGRSPHTVTVVQMLAGLPDVDDCSVHTHIHIEEGAHE
jgi:hypothetical protein